VFWGFILGAISGWVVNKWFKKKPLWLQGGIIGFTAGFIIGVLMTLFAIMGGSSIAMPPDAQMWQIWLMFLAVYCLMGIFFGICGFIIGAILGWIIEKMKFLF